MEYLANAAVFTVGGVAISPIALALAAAAAVLTAVLLLRKPK